MKKIKYSLTAGRQILVNDKSYVFLVKGDDISPVDADIFAHRVVNALNHRELLRQNKVVTK